MTLGIGDNWPLIYMAIMQYSGSDPVTQASVESFNWYFSVTFEFGVIAWLFTVVVTLLARS